MGERKTPIIEKIFVVFEDKDDLYGHAKKITTKVWEEIMSDFMISKRDTGRVEYVHSCYCFNGNSYLMKNGIVHVGNGSTLKTPSIRMIRLYAENRKGRMQKLEQEVGLV